VNGVEANLVFALLKLRALLSFHNFMRVQEEGIRVEEELVKKEV